MSKPKLLDLFCGAGGASMGYYHAGFDVVGVDIKPQKNYPFEFIQADAMTFPLDGFDAIHASPPCQAYSVLRRANPDAEYPELINPMRERLQASGKPWVMENVPGAPLLYVLILCGTMFGLGANGRHLRRHRLFESNCMLLRNNDCSHVGEAIGVYGGGGWTELPKKKKGGGRYTFGNLASKQVGVRRGGYQGLTKECREAMGIDWMTRKELTQAIPPAYTEFIGLQLLNFVKLGERK